MIAHGNRDNGNTNQRPYLYILSKCNCRDHMMVNLPFRNIQISIHRPYREYSIIFLKISYSLSKHLYLNKFRINQSILHRHRLQIRNIHLRKCINQNLMFYGEQNYNLYTSYQCIYKFNTQAHILCSLDQYHLRNIHHHIHIIETTNAFFKNYHMINKAQGW